MTLIEVIDEILRAIDRGMARDRDAVGILIARTEGKYPVLVFRGPQTVKAGSLDPQAAPARALRLVFDSMLFDREAKFTIDLQHRGAGGGA